MKRVGYYISEKKSKNMGFEDQKDLFRNSGVDLIKIDVDRPLDDQGPFDLLLHKATDILIRANQGYVTAQEEFHNLQDYISRHPTCIVVDPLESLQRLLDRTQQYNLVMQCKMMETDSTVFMPTFAELTTTDIDTNKQKLKDAGVEFPIVCKPIIAHGSVSHQMSLIFSAEGLKDVRPPCVAQTFINHNAVLYKMFVIGSKQFIVKRPSLKNMHPSDRKTVFFDSQDVSKPDSSFFLSELDNSDAGEVVEVPGTEIMHQLSKAIRSALNMDLIGVDVIVEANGGRYAVIDINAFPGYDGVDKFFQILLDYLLKLMNNKQADKTSDADMGRRPTLKETGRKLSESEEAASRKKLKSDEAPDCNNCNSGANELPSTCTHCRQSDSSNRTMRSTSVATQDQISDTLHCSYPVNGHVFELSERQQT